MPGSFPHRIVSSISRPCAVMTSAPLDSCSLISPKAVRTASSASVAISRKSSRRTYWHQQRSLSASTSLSLKIRKPRLPSSPPACAETAPAPFRRKDAFGFGSGAEKASNLLPYIVGRSSVAFCLPAAAKKPVFIGLRGMRTPNRFVFCRSP